MKADVPRFGLLAVAVTLLSACAQWPLPLVGPDYTSPDLALPSGWTAPAENRATADIARWWRQLGDPRLDGLIDAALAESLDLRLAEARLRQARASRDQAVGGLFPSVTGSAGATRSRSAANIGALPARTTYDAGFDAAWEIDIFGGTRRGIEAATADQAAVAADLDQVRVSLVAEVARNYIDLLSYRRRLSIARDNLASQSETLQIVAWRYQAGLAASTDVEQARTSREQTRAGIPDLEVGQVAAENRLAVLLGSSPGSLRVMLAGDRPFPPVPASVGAGIPADILARRPDLVAAERTLAAETARVGQRLAQRFPSLNLGASFGWQAYSFAALGGSGSLARSLSGSLAATLFDGGRLKSAVAIQSAVQEQALIAYRSGVLAALEEVENALAAYAADRERVEARQAAAEAARNAAQLSRNLYQSGLADFQKVLETERTRLSAEDNLAIAEATMRSDLIKLYKALGGGWEAGAVQEISKDRAS